jgi:hypothetical protein
MRIILRLTSKADTNLLKKYRTFFIGPGPMLDESSTTRNKSLGFPTHFSKERKTLSQLNYTINNYILTLFILARSFCQF